MAFIDDVVSSIGKAEKYLRSNKAINPIYSLLDKPASWISGADNVAASVGRAMDDAAKYKGKDAIRFGMQTYAGLSIGSRLVIGGNLFTNADGEFDIAGIPIL